MDVHLLEELLVITAEEKALLEKPKVDQRVYTNHDRFIIDPSNFIPPDQLIAIRPHTRFVQFPKHTHDYIEIFYMYNGSLTHRINDNIELTIKKGELLMLNQFVSHSTDYARKDDIGINIILLPEFFDHSLDFFGYNSALQEFIVNSLASRESVPGYLYYDVSNLLPIQNLVENLIWSMLKRDNNHRSNKLTMELLFYELTMHIDKLHITSETQEQIIIADALSEIRNNFKEAKLEVIASRHHISPSYLSKKLKAATGQNFSDLLGHQKMNMAYYYLENSENSVEQIANAVGFSNSSNFCRAYKQYYGINPRS